MPPDADTAVEGNLSPKEQVARLQQQLAQAQKMCSLGALASTITHEFNNILTTVINYAKLGLRHHDEQSRDKALSKILSAAQRASRITGSLLSFARIRGDQQEPTDVAGLVEDLLPLVERDLNKHRVQLETQFEGRPRAVVNGTQIQQVLLNLIINARQAMPQGGRIQLSVRHSAESGMVEVAVRDSGTGIPPQKLRHIFDPFFSTKTRADSGGLGGTGLGLSLCRDIIEAHHGRIRVESKSGSGSTFTLKLPAARAEAKAG